MDRIITIHLDVEAINTHLMGDHIEIDTKKSGIVINMTREAAKELMSDLEILLQE